MKPMSPKASLTTRLRPSAFVCCRSLRSTQYPSFKLFARQAATSTQGQDTARSALTRTKNFLIGSTLTLATVLGYFYLTDTRSGVHRWAAVPSLRVLYPDAEDAHEAGTKLLKTLYSFGLHPRERGKQDGDLKVEIFGHQLDNAIGTSAGIDKDANVPSALLALGPAIVEVGGITPMPQQGNPKPRVFRIPSQNALINRYGLNSEGAEYVAMQLRRRVRQFADSIGLGLGEESEQYVLDGNAGVPPGSLTDGKMLAVQIAKNKSTPDADFDAVRQDYVDCVEHLGKFADILVVNVSSPNTPGLRSLQQAKPLENILTGVVQAARSVKRKTTPAVMVKVSPDEDSEEQVLGICQAVWASGVDGVIVGNTTKKRPEFIDSERRLPESEASLLREVGGYSGPQTFGRTLALVKRYRSMLDEAVRAYPDLDLEKKVIFATGGITNGEQALEVLDAGANVAMVYTALVYSGVGTISRIKAEMRDQMRRRSLR